MDVNEDSAVVFVIHCINVSNSQNADFVLTFFVFVYHRAARRARRLTARPPSLYCT